MSQQNNSSNGVSPIYIVGMGLAAYSSWTLNASIGWACVHALFGWMYLIYLCGGCGGGLPPGVF